MRFPGKWPSKGDTPVDRQQQRQLTLDRLRDRGTAQKPQPPRELIVQAAPRGVFLTWSLPPVFFDIVGWRVYKSDESTLYHELADQGVRKLFVECSAGTPSSPQFNFFVSSLNGLGQESPKVQIQGASLPETGAPVMPGVPPGYNSGSSGGGSTGTRHGYVQY